MDKFQIDKLTKCFMAIADFSGRDTNDNVLWEEKLNAFESAIHMIYLLGDNELVYEVNKILDAFPIEEMAVIKLDPLLQLLRERIRDYHRLKPLSSPMKFLRLKRVNSFKKH